VSLLGRLGSLAERNKGRMWMTNMRGEEERERRRRGEHVRKESLTLRRLLGFWGTGGRTVREDTASIIRWEALLLLDILHCGVRDMHHSSCLKKIHIT
jgi:hypothetical protein